MGQSLGRPLPLPEHIPKPDSELFENMKKLGFGIEDTEKPF
jgi:hypothetical protein